MEVEYRNITTEHIDDNLYSDKKIAVHLHIFYTDLLPELCKHLSYIPIEFDVFVSVPDTLVCDCENIKSMLHKITCVKHVSLARTPNRGRDIAPMICSFGKKLLDYDIILHLHTKLSPHNKEYDKWRPFMLEHILHSIECVKSILALLGDDVGIVCARDFISDASTDHWGKNKKLAKELLQKCNIDIDIDKDYPITDFPAGTFFWARREAVAQLLSLPLSYNDFPSEPIETDGTLAHALERLVFILADEKKFKNVKLYFLGGYNEEYMGLNSLALRNAKHIRVMQRLIYLCICLAVALCVSLLSNIMHLLS